MVVWSSFTMEKVMPKFVLKEPVEAMQVGNSLDDNDLVWLNQFVSDGYDKDTGGDGTIFLREVNIDETGYPVDAGDWLIARNGKLFEIMEHEEFANTYEELNE